jgi:glucan phosphoethanolaminetransferase (alkaline phosphatase superfamily)
MYIFTWIGIADQYVALWLSSITGLFVLFTTISLLMITIIRQSKLSDEAMDRKLSIALSIFILTISITLVFDYKNWGGFIAINDPARHLYSMAMAFISFSLVTNIGNNDKNKRTILALFMVSLIGSINDKIFLVWGGVR